MLKEETTWSAFLKFYEKETKPVNAKRKRTRIKSVSPIYNAKKHRKLKLELGYE